MKIKRVTTIFFSATGTSQQIVNAVIEGLDIDEVRQFNLTDPKVRKSFSNPNFMKEELLIIGAPVYAARIPDFIIPALHKLTGEGQPVVLISVYGNIDEGIALEQLKNISKKSRFRTLAAASFIGEHSYSRIDNKVGYGRPDEKDLEEAKDFGIKINNKLKKINIKSDVKNIRINYKKSMVSKIVKRISLPQCDSKKLIIKTPKVDKDKCNHCEKCVTKCPMGAIEKETLRINNKECIRCMACVKRCPNEARQIEYSLPKLVKTFFKLKNSNDYNKPRYYYR